MRPEAVLATCRASDARFERGVARLTDVDLAAPSRLPRYSRGHVVAHLVNKADAHAALFDAAASGEVGRLFPPGYDADAAADAGSRRSPAELHTALVDAFARLEAAWAALDADGWDRKAEMTAGPRTMTEVLRHHLRNVEVHHVDLDVGYEPADWPADFVDDELARRLRGLPGRAAAEDLLAWLLDRGPAPELGPW